MNDVEGAPIEELPVASCWSLLRDAPIGRVALAGEADVEIFPVNFLVDQGSIVFRTAAGTKLSMIDEGGRATFEADGIDAADTAWSVVVKGVVRIVRGHEAITESMDIEVLTWHAGPKPTYVRLEPDVITGRRFPRSAV